MDKLFNRLIYIEIIILVVLSIVLIPLFLFPEHIPDVILFSFIDLVAPYDFEAAEKILRKGLLTQFLTPGVLTIFIGLWFVCLILLLKRKKIAVQILYFLVVIDLVSILFLGDEILTPFLSFITVIEAYIIGALIYMVTFSKLKKEFK